MNDDEDEINDELLFRDGFSTLTLGSTRAGAAAWRHADFAAEREAAAAASISRLCLATSLRTSCTLTSIHRLAPSIEVA